MTNSERLGKDIAEMRKQRGWTVNELAEKCGLLRPNMSRVEAGTHSTGIEILSKIAHAFGKKIDFVDEL